MSAFVTLPSDLIDTIFGRLEHIDDALNLADSCRKFKAHLAAENSMIQIIRAIMGNSYNHINDISLTRLTNSGDDLKPEHGRNIDWFLGFFRREAALLSDDEVNSIVRSRQSIRPIQSLYLNLSVHNQYRRSSFPAWRSECIDVVECMFQETPAAAITKPAFSARRFSDAVVAYGVLIEARKLIIRLKTQTRSLKEHLRFSLILDSFWCNNGMRTPLQTLDMLEVHDFIYGFLIRKMYYRAWWPELENEDMGPVDKTWARNLQLLGSCLSPTDAARIGSMEGELSDPALWKRLPVNQTQFYLTLPELPPALVNNIDCLSVANILEFNLSLDLLRLDQVEYLATGRRSHLVEAWGHF